MAKCGKVQEGVNNNNNELVYYIKPPLKNYEIQSMKSMAVT